jgi:hypothetical protein
MQPLPETAVDHVAKRFTRSEGHGLVSWLQFKTWAAFLLLGISATALCTPHTPTLPFAGVLHARGPHGVYTEIRFEPRGLVAQVHEPHMCVLHAHLVHGDPRSSRYAIEPPNGGRFCDELVDGEIVVHPKSPNDVIAEFRSPRMNWSGEFRSKKPSR